MSNETRYDENATCTGCGRFGAYLFDGEQLCGECYEKRGSCCPEFGAHDLWRQVEELPSPVKRKALECESQTSESGQASSRK